MGEKKLLFSLTRKDFDVQVFCCGGKGGQNMQKNATGVRIVHRESGAVGESREERSQAQNKKLAFERMVKSSKFRLWHAKRVKEIEDGQSLEEKVDKMMDQKNLKVEIRDGKGKWVIDPSEELEIDAPKDRSSTMATVTIGYAAQRGGAQAALEGVGYYIVD